MTHRLKHEECYIFGSPPEGNKEWICERCDNLFQKGHVEYNDPPNLTISTGYYYCKECYAFLRCKKSTTKLGGTKNDQGKIRLELLSTKWLCGVGEVLTFGAKKYAPHNWRSGIEASRLIGAALRHISAWNDGEDNDPETNLSHLSHASCCLMFLSELYQTMPEKVDDRYNKGETKKIILPDDAAILPSSPHASHLRSNASRESNYKPSNKTDNS